MAYRFLLLLVEFVSKLVAEGRLHVVAVRLQLVAGVNLGLDSLVLLRKLFSLCHHPVDLLLAQAALVVGDSDLLLLACIRTGVIRYSIPDMIDDLVTARKKGKVTSVPAKFGVSS